MCYSPLQYAVLVHAADQIQVASVIPRYADVVLVSAGAHPQHRPTCPRGYGVGVSAHTHTLDTLSGLGQLLCCVHIHTICYTLSNVYRCYVCYTIGPNTLGHTLLGTSHQQLDLCCPRL